MIAYQPETLNTLDPYCGPQGFGMQSGSSQTIDNITSVKSNQIIPVPYRAYSIPTPSKAYSGLSEDLEMRPRGGTGRPIIPGSGAPSSRPSSSTSSTVPGSGSITLPGSGSSRAEQINTARNQAIQSAIPTLPTVPGTGQVTLPKEPVTTPAKPWYKSPLYLALLAGGIFLMAKKYKYI